MERFSNISIIGFTNIDTNIIPNKQPEVLPGGAGYFAAVAASQITKPIGLVTRVGNDYPLDFLLTRVLPEGIHIIPDKHTSRYTIKYYSETNLSIRDIQSDTGTSKDLQPKDIPPSWLLTTQYFHVGPMPPEQQKLFLSFLKAHAPQAIISTDTEESLLKDLKNVPSIGQNLMMADFIFVNRTEYATLKSIVDSHPFAIVKLDKDGAICLRYGKEIARAQSPSVTVVDATGAGDVLAGTFIANTMIRDNLQANLQEAVNAASLSVTQKGIYHLLTHNKT